MADQNRIQLSDRFISEEAVAGASGIYPGHLVKLNSDAEAVVHDTEGGVAERAFAVEDAFQGNTVSDAYTEDEKLMYHIQQRGGRVNALIQAGQNLAVGDILISAGDGTLIDEDEAGSGVSVADRIAVALEAIDLSASGAVATLAKVRIL